ncbi:MAG: hypothetical protein ACPG1A_11570 [Halioglobus sp.]
MSARNNRFLRTLLLGVAAMGALVWVVIDQFNLDPQEMFELFLTVLLASGVMMLLAALVALLWIGIRRLARGAERDREGR